MPARIVLLAEYEKPGRRHYDGEANILRFPIERTRSGPLLIELWTAWLMPWMVMYYLAGWRSQG